MHRLTPSSHICQTVYHEEVEFTAPGLCCRSIATVPETGAVDFVATWARARVQYTGACNTPPGVHASTVTTKVVCLFGFTYYSNMIFCDTHSVTFGYTVLSLWPQKTQFCNSQLLLSTRVRAAFALFDFSFCEGTVQTISRWLRDSPAIGTFQIASLVPGLITPYIHHCIQRNKKGDTSPTFLVSEIFA